MISTNKTISITDPTIDREEKTTIICQHERGEISCPDDKILKIKEAIYGRSDSSTCTNGARQSEELEDTECFASVTEYVRKWFVQKDHWCTGDWW